MTRLLLGIAVGVAIALLGIWGYAIYATPMGTSMPSAQWSASMMGGMGQGMGMHGGMGRMMQGAMYANMTGTQMQEHMQYCAQMMQQSNYTKMMGSNTVVIANFQFLPTTLTVKQRTTVTWVNMDQVAHTVSAGTHEQETGLFESGLLERMGSFSFTFTQPGTYTYHCDPHPYMTGTIVVES
jgi:plastocyanin